MKIALLEVLPEPYQSVLQNLIAGIQGSWQVNHKADGTHSQIDASSNVIAQGMGSFYGQPRCRITKRATNQTIPNATDTFLTWLKPVNPNGFPEDGYDTTGLFDPDGSGMWFCPVEKGLYLLQCRVRFAANAVGKRVLAISPSLAIDEPDIDRCAVNSAADDTSLFVSQIIVNDPLLGSTSGIPGVPARYRFYVHQDSGGNLDVNGSALSTWVQMTKLA